MNKSETLIHLIEEAFNIKDYIVLSDKKSRGSVNTFIYNVNKILSNPFVLSVTVDSNADKSTSINIETGLSFKSDEEKKLGIILKYLLSKYSAVYDDILSITSENKQIAKLIQSINVKNKYATLTPKKLKNGMAYRVQTDIIEKIEYFPIGLVSYVSEKEITVFKPKMLDVVDNIVMISKEEIDFDDDKFDGSRLRGISSYNVLTKDTFVRVDTKPTSPRGLSFKKAYKGFIKENYKDIGNRSQKVILKPMDKEFIAARFADQMDEEDQ